MSEEEKEGLIGEIEHGPSKFDQFLEKNFKLLIIGAVVIALAAAAFVVLKELKKDKEHTAGAGLADATDSSDYQKVIDKHSGTNAAGTAQILLANQQWQDGQQDKSIGTLTNFISEQPDPPAIPTAQLSLGQRYASQGKNDLAKEQFLAVTNNDNGNYIGAFAHIALGNLEKAAGNKDAALGYYEQARDGYPNNSPVSPSSKFLATQLIDTIDSTAPEAVAAEPAPSEAELKLPTPPESPSLPIPSTPETTTEAPSAEDQTAPAQLSEEAPAPDTETEEATDPAVVEATEMPETPAPSFIPDTAEGEDAAPALSDKVRKFAHKLTSVNAEDEAALNKIYQDLANDGGSNFLYRIPFATGETGVPSAHQEALIAKLKAANPEATLVTIGYADTRGDDALNKRLSYGRAREVASWIKSTLGTESGLETFSMGETDRFSKDDFSKNRVVEVWQITE